MPVSNFSNTVAQRYQATAAIAAGNGKSHGATPVFDIASAGSKLKSGLLIFLRGINRAKLAWRQPRQNQRHFSNLPDLRGFLTVPAIEITALTLVATIAIATLLLWVFPAFDHLAPPLWSKMSAATAAALLLSACSLAISMQKPPADRPLGMIAAGIVVPLGAWMLLEYVAGLSSGVYAFFVHPAFSPAPGRQLPLDALAFMALGISMLAMRQTKDKQSRLANISTLLFLALNVVMLGIVAFGALHISSPGAPQLHIGPQTLGAICCLSIVVVLRRARKGDWLAVLFTPGIGGSITRRMLPAALGMPFALLAVAAILVKSGRVDNIYAESITATAGAMMGFFLVLLAGRRIDALERELRDLSLTDELTSVYNRRGFYFLAQQAIRDAERGLTGLTLFFFDLDGLKQVNDNLGHESGSEMIQAFAEILNATFRKSDIVGRVGGDEFAVMTIRDDGLALETVHQRLEHFTRKHNKANQSYQLGFSFGQAELRKGEGDTLDEMVTRADSLMYQAKAKKKLQVNAWFTPADCMAEAEPQPERLRLPERCD